SGGSVKLFTAVEDDRISIFVKDTGIGIAPQHKLRIFDRFYRVVPDNGHLPDGSGLGLALAKWIADCHGAELTADSQAGHGSCFSFSLKRTPPPCQASDEGITSLFAPVDLSKLPSIRVL